MKVVLFAARLLLLWALQLAASLIMESGRKWECLMQGCKTSVGFKAVRQRELFWGNGGFGAKQARWKGGRRGCRSWRCSRATRCYIASTWRAYMIVEIIHGIDTRAYNHSQGIKAIRKEIVARFATRDRFLAIDIFQTKWSEFSRSVHDHIPCKFQK